MSDDNAILISQNSREVRVTGEGRDASRPAAARARVTVGAQVGEMPYRRRRRRLPVTFKSLSALYRLFAGKKYRPR